MYSLHGCRSWPGLGGPPGGHVLESPWPPVGIPVPSCGCLMHRMRSQHVCRKWPGPGGAFNTIEDERFNTLSKKYIEEKNIAKLNELIKKKAEKKRKEGM